MRIKRLEEYDLTLDADDAILWLIRERTLNRIRPPYIGSFAVLPGFLYLHMRWMMPRKWFPPGSGHKGILDFLGGSQLSDGRTWKLYEESLLLDQLKQIAVVLLHHASLVGHRAKPVSISATFKILRKFMHAVQACGCESLSEVTPYNIQQIIDLHSRNQGTRLTVALWVERLVRLSELGYIQDGLNDYDFEIEVGNENPDTSTEKGEQPLNDQDRQLVLSNALRVVDCRKDFTNWVRACLEDVAAVPDARMWLMERFPGAQRSRYSYPSIFHRLYHGAAGYLIADAIGPRPSELLSAMRGFIRIVDGEPATVFDRYELTTETSKAQKSWRGVQRHLRVSSLLFEVAEGLEEMHDLFEKTTERLFSPPYGGNEYTTNNFNHVLRTFCRINEIPFSLTAYTGRKTLVRNAARAVTNGLAAAEVILDHAHRGETAGYALSNSFVREDIHAESMDIFQDKSRTLLESTLAAGGAGLGGEQGRRIEMRMAALMSENQGIVVNEVIEVFLEELLRQGIAPIPVMAGVLCVKKGSVRGSCSKSTGDTLPDVGKCTAECPYQVQEMHRHALIRWELEKVAREGFASLSRLQKVYWLDHIREQLHAWPDLKPKLDEIVNLNPEIGRMI
ncbi:hypothetical protein D3C80_164460 [compost metagenome]